MNIKGVKNDSTVKKSIGIGVLISILTGLVFIAVFAFIMTAGDLPKSAAAPLSSVAFGIGCFFGGKYTAAKVGVNGYIYGAANGGIVLLAVTVCGMIVTGAQFSYVTLLRAAIVMLSAMIGGVLGVNKKSSSRLVK